jgi:hypothetical protein
VGQEGLVVVIHRSSNLLYCGYEVYHSRTDFLLVTGYLVYVCTQLLATLQYSFFETAYVHGTRRELRLNHILEFSNHPVGLVHISFQGGHIYSLVDRLVLCNGER